MIARTGAILAGIILLCFITTLLIADMLSPTGFRAGKSLASFFQFLTSSEECDCELSSQLQEKICNTFCGEHAGKVCKDKADCLG